MFLLRRLAEHFISEVLAMTLYREFFEIFNRMDWFLPNKNVWVLLSKADSI